MEQRASLQVQGVSSTPQANEIGASAAANFNVGENHGLNPPTQKTSLPFNPTSTSSFVRQVASVIGTGFEHVDQTGTGIGSHDPAIHYNVKDLVLPPRQVADTFLHNYWDLFHPINPILHRPTFDAVYSQLWQPKETGDSAQDVVFYSTLNIVLALGCQSSQNLAESDRESFASELYLRSVRLISLDSLDTSSLQIVQFLVLRGFCLFYTPYADRCWMTVGSALRVAQGLGIHFESPAAVSSQLDREMHRRVWHNCVLLDW